MHNLKVLPSKCTPITEPENVGPVHVCIASYKRTLHVDLENTGHFVECHF